MSVKDRPYRNENKAGFVCGLIAIMLVLIFAACEQPNDLTSNSNSNSTSTDITYTIRQIGGINGISDTDGIALDFSASVDNLNLTAADITVGGVAVKDSEVLYGMEAYRAFHITVTVGGTATLTIRKTGIETVTKRFPVYKAGQLNPAYTVTQTGGIDGTTDSTGIVFTFNASVDSLNLTAADITVDGAAVKGSATLTGSGTSRTLAPITVNAAGMATVSIVKDGIETVAKDVIVYKAGQAAPGTAGLAYELINYSAYRVRAGTVTSGAVIIPAVYNGLPVTEIGSASDDWNNYAFYNTSITFIHIPASVTYIGERAFRGCTRLTEITIPEGVTFIGEDAFWGCTGITDIIIDNDTFMGTWGIIFPSDSLSVTFKKNVGDDAFWGCPSLVSVTITEGVTFIGGSAFYNCPNLVSVTIAEGVTSIGESAFYNCARLTSITIPEGITSIGGGAFYNCARLTEITIPIGVTEINDGTFTDCTSLTSITIPEGVTSIGGGAFYNCTSLTSITIPEGVTSIGDGAFVNCTRLSEITIPTSVTSIGTNVFNGCSSLTEITIPAGVTSMGGWPFNSWTPSQTIYIEGHASQTEADSAWTTWRIFCYAKIVYLGNSGG